jgi:hypothetical protein
MPSWLSAILLLNLLCVIRALRDPFKLKLSGGETLFFVKPGAPEQNFVAAKRRL